MTTGDIWRSPDQLRLLNDDVTTPDGARDCWRTPQSLFRRLDDQYRFVCDVACDESNCLVPDGVRLGDALKADWPRKDNGWCFLNPPFSMLPEFMAKTCEEADKQSRIIALVPGHRCEQDWWLRYVVGKAQRILYPRGRVEYVPPPGVASSSPSFPSVVLVYMYGASHYTNCEAL